MDILSIPVYYISFNRSYKIENYYRKVGFKNVNHFNAIDGRKFKPKDLMIKNIITARSFRDLTCGRESHPGLSSLGAVGCTLSHLSLWEKCVNENMPYMIIAEEDNRFYNDTVTDKDLSYIENTISNPNTIFIATKIKKERCETSFVGLHFYVVRNDACKAMIKRALPISVQTDWYLANLVNIGELNVVGKEIAFQYNVKGTMIQDGCIKCYIPGRNSFYRVNNMYNNIYNI